MAVVLTLLVAVIANGCSLVRQEPQIIRDLVAVAPAGSKVSVEHLDKPLIGGDAARWTFSFESTNAEADLLRYRHWFEGHGFAVVLESGGPGFGVCADYTGMGPAEDPATGHALVSGWVSDNAIDSDGNLVAASGSGCP